MAHSCHVCLDILICLKIQMSYGIGETSVVVWVFCFVTWERFFAATAIIITYSLKYSRLIPVQIR